MMTARAASSFALACVLAVWLVACGSAPPAPPPAPSAAPAEPSGPPRCPEAIVAGGDPIEAESFAGREISRVCVLGGTDESRKAAEKSVSVKAGDTANVDRIRIDLESILRLGMFEDAAAYGLPGRDRMMLIYVVRERAKIGEVVFEGAKLLGDAAMAAKFPVEKQSPYDPARVHEFAQAVRDEYRARGYESCEVKQIAEPLPGGLVRLRLKVTEGPRWHYGKLVFKGNAKAPEADLLKAAALQTGKPFVQEEIDRSVLALSALYYDRGMIEFRVDVDYGEPRKDGGLDVVFTIQEGDVYTIGALHASRLGAPVEKELLSRIKARPKQTFSRGGILEDMERMKAFFASKGQRVDIEPKTELDPKKKTADVTFEIDAAK